MKPPRPPSFPACLRVLALGLMLASAACYAGQGAAWTRSSQGLLAEAQRACQRNDRRAMQTLLHRIVEEYPTSEEALLASRHLGTCSDCTANEAGDEKMCSRQAEVSTR